jgi:hypothetical protein
MNFQMKYIHITQRSNLQEKYRNNTRPEVKNRTSSSLDQKLTAYEADSNPTHVGLLNSIDSQKNIPCKRPRMMFHFCFCHAVFLLTLLLAISSNQRLCHLILIPTSRRRIPLHKPANAASPINPINPGAAISLTAAFGLAVVVELESFLGAGPAPADAHVLSPTFCSST